MGEIALMRQFQYEAAQRVHWVRLFRRNILALKVDDRFVKAGLAGQCDLYGYAHGGRCIEIEMKSKQGKLNPKQEHWRDWCKEWDIPWVALWPKKGESAQDTVKRWIEEMLCALR